MHGTLRTLLYYLLIISKVYRRKSIAIRILNVAAYQTSLNAARKVYKHRELVLDTSQMPKITLNYEKMDNSPLDKLIVNGFNELSFIEISLSGVLKVMRVPKSVKIVTVGIDYGKHKIGVFTPETAVTLHNDCNFFEKLKEILPASPYQIVVGFPYSHHKPNEKCFPSKASINNGNDRNCVTYIPQILTCIDFANTLINRLVCDFGIDNFNFSTEQASINYSCKCQTCLIKQKKSSKMHPSDIFCPEKFEIIDLPDHLFIPPVYVSSESYSSANSDMFSNFGKSNKLDRLESKDVHIRSSYLIARDFEKKTENSLYVLPSKNSLPADFSHKRLYLKALTKLAKITA